MTASEAAQPLHHEPSHPRAGLSPDTGTENITQAVRSVAAQPEVIQIIVADNDSDDGTSAILDALRTLILQLCVLKVGDPPKGWIVKVTRALRASREDTGNCLLFSDPDMVHQPGSLAQMADRARRGHADLLSL